MAMDKKHAGKMGKTTKQHGNTTSASKASGRSTSGKGVRKPEIK